MSEALISSSTDAYGWFQGRVQVRVRYVECDPMNVAHHSVYPIWLEIARTELLRHRGITYRQIEEQGVFIVVARMSLQYRKPAYYDDLLTIQVQLQETSGVKIEHRYEIYRNNELLAQAQTTLACTDAQGKLIPVPDCLKSPSSC